jgi:Domain of unknown function (DUF4288)
MLADVNEPVADGSKLYVAVLVSESSSDAQGYEPLLEESFLLVSASSDERASSRARQLGLDAETSYDNDAGETVTWRLKHVVDVSRTLSDELEHGTTLYSRHFRDYDSYRRFEPLLSEDGGP